VTNDHELGTLTALVAIATARGVLEARRNHGSISRRTKAVGGEAVAHLIDAIIARECGLVGFEAIARAQAPAVLRRWSQQRASDTDIAKMLDIAIEIVGTVMHKTAH
jgi:hypothetical protein